MLSLESFINKKIKNYVPPEKKGVPRGEPIGFPREKYYASLLLLHTDSLKDIAKKVNSPYGSLRNWKAEGEFNEMVHRHATEFIKSFRKSIEIRAKKQYEKVNNLFKNPLILGIENFPLAKSDVKELQDIKNFSKYLSVKIVQQVFKEFEQMMIYFGTAYAAPEFDLKYPKSSFNTNDSNKHTTKQRLGKNSLDSKYTGIIYLLTIINELLTVLSMFSGSKTNMTIIYKKMQVLQLNFVRSMFLHEKNNKEEDRKVAFFLLSRVIQSLK